MKVLTLIFALLIIETTNAQNSIIYKRNPATGVLEVYESQYGFPVGQRIGDIKQNPISGYVEITNYEKDKIKAVAESPYTRKPNYDIQKFTPFNLPYQSLIDQIETLNRRHEYQLLEREPIKQVPNSTLEEIKETFRTETNFADNFLNFYNSLSTFPLKLKDGFYNTAEISDSYMNPLTKLSNRTYVTGIAKVFDGKLVEYYGNIYLDNFSTTTNVYRKYNLAAPIEIKNCKSLFYEPGGTLNQIYFLENLITSNNQIPDPNFGFYTFYTDGLNSPDNQITLLHKIGRDLGREINFNDISFKNNSGALGYFAGTFLSNRSYQFSCNNSNITFAFRPNKGKYSLSVLIPGTAETDFVKTWWKVDNIIITPNSCSSTVLKN